MRPLRPCPLQNSWAESAQFAWHALPKLILLLHCHASTSFTKHAFAPGSPTIGEPAHCAALNLRVLHDREKIFRQITRVKLAARFLVIQATAHTLCWNHTLHTSLIVQGHTTGALTRSMVGLAFFLSAMDTNSFVAVGSCSVASNECT